jgi:hypothetical protein
MRKFRGKDFRGVVIQNGGGTNARILGLRRSIAEFWSISHHCDSRQMGLVFDLLSLEEHFYGSIFGSSYALVGLHYLHLLCLVHGNNITLVEGNSM